MGMEAAPKASSWAITRGGAERKEPKPEEGGESARVELTPVGRLAR